jgi:hypothetical protein
MSSWGLDKIDWPWHLWASSRLEAPCDEWCHWSFCAGCLRSPLCWLDRDDEQLGSSPAGRPSSHFSHLIGAQSNTAEAAPRPGKPSLLNDANPSDLPPDYFQIKRYFGDNWNSPKCLSEWFGQLLPECSGSQHNHPASDFPPRAGPAPFLSSCSKLCASFSPAWGSLLPQLAATFALG